MGTRVWRMSEGTTRTAPSLLIMAASDMASRGQEILSRGSRGGRSRERLHGYSQRIIEVLIQVFPLHLSHTSLRSTDTLNPPRYRLGGVEARRRKRLQGLPLLDYSTRSLASSLVRRRVQVIESFPRIPQRGASLTVPAT